MPGLCIPNVLLLLAGIASGRGVPLGLTQHDASGAFDLIEGDIRVEAVDVERAAREGRVLGSTPTDEDGLFPRGEKVRYYIDRSLSSKDKRISGAVEEWEEKTCLRFERCTSTSRCRKPYMKFQRSSGCSSPVGLRRAGINTISLASGCSTGNTVHEIGHSLGLSHEQKRKDRDEYVKVDLGEVKSGHSNNFRQSKDSSRDLGPYNYGSIMHYSSKAWAKGRKPTIIAPHPIGQRKGLSEGDVSSIEFLYTKCSKKFSTPRCMASVDEGKTHVIPHSKTWNFDVSVLYDKPVRVSYDGTTAPKGDVKFSASSGSSVPSGDGFVELAFKPTKAMGGQTYTLSATFKGSDKRTTTCSVRVQVEGSGSSSGLVCYGKAATDKEVCSGHGRCVGRNECKCESGFTGTDCSGFESCPSNELHDFDDDVEPWTFKGPGDIDVRFAAEGHGGGSLRVGIPSERGTARLELDSPTQPQRMTFYMAAMDGRYRSPKLSFRKGGKTCFSVRRSSGVWRVGSARSSVQVAMKQFYFMDARVDWARGRVVMYIDGKKVISSAPFDATCREGMDDVELQGNGWLDEFRALCSDYVVMSGSLLDDTSAKHLRDGGATLTLTLVSDHDSWKDTSSTRSALVRAFDSTTDEKNGWNDQRDTLLGDRRPVVSISGKVAKIGPLNRARGYSIKRDEVVQVGLSKSMFRSGNRPVTAAHELSLTVDASTAPGFSRTPSPPRTPAPKPPRTPAPRPARTPAPRPSDRQCKRSLRFRFDSSSEMKGSHVQRSSKHVGGGSSMRFVRTRRDSTFDLGMMHPREFQVWARVESGYARLQIRLHSSSRQYITLAYGLAYQLYYTASGRMQRAAGRFRRGRFQKIEVHFDWTRMRYRVDLADVTGPWVQLPTGFDGLQKVVMSAEWRTPAYVDEMQITC